MSKLAKGNYQVTLDSLTKAVATASVQVFAQKDDQLRLCSRVMAEVDKTLVLVPDTVAPAEHPDEVPILDSSYRATIESTLKLLASVSDYTALKVEMRMFAEAWEAAHEFMDCGSLMWAGWDEVFTRLIRFMDLEGDAGPVFVMSVALQQWRKKMQSLGVPAIQPNVAPYLHFHVEVKAGESKFVRLAMGDTQIQLQHLHKLGVNHDRDRYLLTVMNDIPARRVHHLLKIDSVTKLTGGKIDLSS